MCWPFRHKWTYYEEPRQITNTQGLPEVAQRRHCRECHAVDYRRVKVSNHL